MSNPAVCEVCGDPMPPGEEVFNYHGYSGPCPKPPLPREVKPTVEEQTARLAASLEREALLTLDRDKLAAFKVWVHAWLDHRGVPADPMPEQTATTGCRISGRMEWLWAERAVK